MPQTQTLTTAQLNGYLTQIQKGGVADAVQVYQQLYDKGYNYAGWAQGVATGETITGTAALDYLTGTAMIGLGGPECRNLSPAQIDKIRRDMAEGYVQTLIDKAKRNDNQLSTDVDFGETQDFHQIAFEKNGLTLDNWTLSTPMELIRQTQGEAAVEAAWQRIRDTGGSGLGGVLASHDLHQEIGKLANSPDPAIAKKANDWIERVPGTATFDGIGRLWTTIENWLNRNGMEIGGDPFTGMPWPGGMSDDAGAAGAAGTTPPRRDPLVLDLDGDGIETTSTRDGTVILFDHDADGVKTGTGWVKPDDGWLVLDRNGNGSIDSGRELFGVDTLKRNGQLATDGFDAIKDLDANQDGKITAADSAFANLRIWRDLNQDGISQANELTALSANRITAIGVNSSAVRTDLGNGNLQSAAGTFTRSDGTSGATGETNSAAGNLDLLVNTFYRQFTDHITLTDQAKALPNLRGSGRVRDLSEAISLSADLGNWVQTYTQQTTRQGQIDQLDGLINKWANTADLKSLKAQADALSRSGVSLSYNLAGLTAGTPAYDAFVSKLGVVERFMGFTYGGANGEARFTALNAASGNITVTLAAEQIATISLAYDRFKSDIYESLLLPTRLSTYFDKLGVALVAGQVVFNFQPLETFFKQAIASSPRDGIIDLVEFMSAAGEARLTNLGWNATEFLVTQLNAAPDLGAFSEELSSWTVRLAGAGEHDLTGTSRPDLLVGTAGVDYLYGRDGNDILLGKGGNDYIHAENGNDVIDGGTGNDYLNGGTGADTYVFGKGSGQDTVYNYDGEAVGTNADTILLGTGIATTGVTLIRSSDDLIISLNGSDDSLRVQSYFYTDGASSYVVENLKFADGTVWDVATIKTKVLTATVGNDTLTGYATNDIINAGDGNDTVYGQAGDDVLDGGTGVDNVQGGEGNDTVKGGTGNDTLYGGNGNDSLQGNEHNDNLSGNEGNDTLDGGTGNDYLNGGTGADTYVFGKGSGQDTVYNYDGEAVGTNADTILLGTGIATTGVTLIRSSDDLIISLNGSDDSLRVQSYFYTDGASSYVVENLKFADGTVWNYATVKANLSTATPPASITVNGAAANEALTGGLGNDTVYGNDGNDTLDGGLGNDTLDGGAGNDTYLFGKGSGKDTISAYDGTVGKIDLIQLGAGVLTTNVVLKREGNNLVLSINASSDTLRVNNYFYNDATYGYQVEQIKFADGTIWDVNTVKTKVLTATSENDTLTGYASADTLSGLAGDDTVYAKAGNDTIDGGTGEDQLYGEDGDDIIRGGTQNDRLDGGNGNDNLQGQDGDDTLYGQDGNDTIDGGLGNDTLDGGAGNDTYLFGKGSGKDTISAYDGTVGKIDLIQLGAGVLTTNVVLKREGNNLVLSINASSDTLRVNNYFYNDATYGYQVEQIKFADGTIWDVNTVKTKVLTATSENDTLTGYASADTLSGLAGDDTVYAKAGNDTIDGGTGEDQLYGEDGDDIIRGGTQNDRLDGGNGNDNLQGQDGDDTLYGQDGNDTIDGGLGNDTLDGGAGNDTYLFGKGSGKDTISAYDGTVGKIDLIQLGAGVLTTNVVLKREGNNLVLSINASSDTLRVNNYFYNDATYGYQVEQIKFTDGTIWDVNTVKIKVLAATAGDDILIGYATADTLTGGLGEDSLNGVAGNDTLNGGEGNDYLDGGDGIDTLDGGTGNDVLYGGLGNNIFLFGKGDGQDVVKATYDTTAGKLNTLQLKAGVLASEVVIKQAYDTNFGGNGALEVSIAGTTDKITFDGFFYGDNPANAYNGLQQIKFADGTIWNSATLLSNLFAGTANNDVLRGTTAADTLTGGAGDDNLNGAVGNDTLIGGSGNDVLNGGAGNDTYVFGRGSGLDVISDYDSTARNTDVLSVGTGVAANQMWFRQAGSDLEISIIGTTDKSTISNWYSGSAFHVEQFKTSDGKTLLDSQVDLLVSAMAAFAPPAAGQTTLPANYQTVLNPVIAANWK